MAKGVNEVDSWAVASYVDCRSPTLSPAHAPAWWWSTALAAVDETATMPVEWCATLGIADESTFAKGAEVFMNALVGQTYLPWSENFPRQFRAIDAA